VKDDDIILYNGANMIEVIAGCMFSGKSEELNRRLRMAEISGQSISAYKPKIDDRYHSTSIASHANSKFSAKIFSDIDELINLIKNEKDTTGCLPDVVAIDEVQFLPKEIVQFVENLAYNGVRVILSGLDQDYLGRPFGPMPDLMAISDNLMKLNAICTAKNSDGKICGKPASKSFRLNVDNTNLIHVGEKDKYQAVCRSCWGKK
jgi:thymidine kinase